MIAAMQAVTQSTLCFAQRVTSDLRFPAPEFETEYAFPPTTAPPPDAFWWGLADVTLLIVALGLAAVFALRKRSRTGLFWLSLGCLTYFGFIRQGCVCPIGAIQNVTLTLCDPNYLIPFSVLAFFLLPLFAALLFGRVFCAAVCPLGAIQDLVIVSPVKVPTWLERALRLIPYTYLALGILFAATGSMFIICRFDPFVSFFRLSGDAHLLVLGAVFLIVGIFVARPYCRYFCPYNVLLSWISRFAVWKLSITPDTCVQCRLCEDACPFSHIAKPTPARNPEPTSTGIRRLIRLFVALPVMLLASWWIGGILARPLARVDDSVALVHQLQRERADPTVEPTLASKAFRESGTLEANLIQEAQAVRARFVFGGHVLGLFLGLVLFFQLVARSVHRRRDDYEPDHSQCFSCGRCFAFCPQDPKNFQGSQEDLHAAGGTPNS